MADAFSTKEYYEGLLKDPIVQEIFKERHGYDLNAKNVATNGGAEKMSATWKTDGSFYIKLCCGTCSSYHGERGIFANPYCSNKHNKSDRAAGKSG